MGAEQVVDVELEKRMRVLPPRKGVVNINNKSLWTTDSEEVERHNAKSSLGEQTKKDTSGWFLSTIIFSGVFSSYHQTSINC